MSRAAPLAALLALAACASGPPAPSDREPAWRRGRAEDVPGVWESPAGELARVGAILRVYYIFWADGRYEAVAILVPFERIQFLALTGRGTWTVDDRGLDLHRGDGPMPLEASGTLRLRLRLGEGTLELQRIPWLSVPAHAPVAPGERAPPPRVVLTR